MERARWVVLALGALAATFGLGVWMATPGGGERTGRVDRVVVERPVGTPITVHPVGGGVGLTRDDIREVVREELAQHSSEPAKATEAMSPDRAGQVQAAAAAAHDVVTAGVERGVWGDRERAALRVQLVQLGPAETREVLTPLFQAINAQQLKLDGPPL